MAALRAVIEYSPETGLFRWLHVSPSDRRKRRGWFAGNVDSRGYLQVWACGRLWLAHRLAWLLMTGALPAEQVDHIDGDRLNNVWANLRPATRTQNTQNKRRYSNNSTGFKGVTIEPRRLSGPRYVAQIKVNGASVYLGSYLSAEEAHAAYVAAAKQHFGDFARAG